MNGSLYKKQTVNVLAHRIVGFRDRQAEQRPQVKCEERTGECENAPDIAVQAK